MPKLTSNSMSMSLGMLYLSCVKMRELHWTAKTEQKLAHGGWHSANALALLFKYFYLEKFSLRKHVKVSDEVKFSMKFSSYSLQICYIDSLFHPHQIDVGNYMFIYIYFLHFVVFFFSILLRKIWPWNIIIFHQNFCFFVVIIWNFYLRVCV